MLSLVPLQANHNPPKNTGQRAAEQQHGVQKPLITSTTCSWICGIGRTLITSTVCSWIGKSLDHLNNLLLGLRHWNRDDQVHQVPLINASKDNVPAPIRANKTYRKRLTQNRHMSMRICSKCSVEMQTTPKLTEVLFNVPVPQNWEKTAGLTYLARRNMKNNSGKAHLQRSTTCPFPQRRPAATMKPDHDRNRLPQREGHRRLSCEIHKEGLLLLFWRCSHSDMKPVSVQHLFVSTHKRLVL